VAVYKRGGVYWYEFSFKKSRVRQSTHQGNANLARTMESAHRTQLAKGEVGIIDKPTVPTLKEFAPRFEKAIGTLCKDKPRTIAFYAERLRRLLNYSPLASAKLDAIGEELIERLKRQRTLQISRRGKPLAVASINRELATLRRLLRLAQEWKVIDRVPRIRLFRGEENREFVLTQQDEELYLHMAPAPLKDVAMHILDTGMRPGEASALEWRHVRCDPAAGSKFGYVHVPGGKSKNAKRNLSLTARVAAMLATRRKSCHGMARFVFPGDDAIAPFLVSSLDHQHTEFRALLGMPAEFVIHSLRHTMLTRLGESGADAFTIMRIAGHSSVTVSQRYVHPSPESLERAFERFDAMNSAARGENSDPTNSPTGQSKRVVEIAPKPSHLNKMGA
jgi:integrase